MKKEILGTIAKKTNAAIRQSGADDTKNAFEVFKKQFENFSNVEKLKQVPKHSDILVVGGGIIGSFTAYWLRTNMPTLTVTVVEKDSSYVKAGTFWSVGGFRQQFSLPENIKMSMFGVEFLKNINENLKCNDEEVDVPIHHDGYLFCGSKQNADFIYQAHKAQLSQDANVQLLDKEELKSKFKWINNSDLELGNFGYNNEGWLDSRKYLLAVRKKAIHMGAEFVEGEVIQFEKKKDDSFTGSVIYDTALVDTYDGKHHPVKFQTVVNAAGPYAANVARLMGIGHSDDFMSPLSVGLPVEPRKRYVYQFYAENGPLLNVPLTIDPSGVWFRRSKKSNYYLCGRNCCEATEPKDLNLGKLAGNDFDYFENHIKPALVHRVPAFENLKVVNGWAGPYEYNTLDQNLIIGRHSVYSNMIFTNGSSGHGLQHACAIGRAVQELICHNEYKTIDLKRFGFERVLKDQPIKEIDVV